MDTNANTVCVSGVRAGVASLPMPGFVREHASERKIVQNSLSLSLVDAWGCQIHQGELYTNL